MFTCGVWFLVAVSVSYVNTIFCDTYADSGRIKPSIRKTIIRKRKYLSDPKLKNESMTRFSFINKEYKHGVIYVNNISFMANMQVMEEFNTVSEKQ